MLETSEPLRKSLERVTEIAKALDDPLIAALPKSIIGITQVFSGDLREGIANLEDSAPLLADKRDFVGSSFGLMAIGVGYARMGEFAKADAAVKHAKEVAEGGDIIARIDTMIGESMVAVTRGDLDVAIPLAQHCTNMAEAAGATACVVGSNMVLGEGLMGKGQFAGAKIAIDRSHDVAEVTNQRMFRPALTAFRRSIATSMGEVNVAGSTFEEALAGALEMRDKWSEAYIYWRRAETDIVNDKPDRDHILGDYAEAERLFTEMGARPSLARLLRDWGKALRVLGMADEGAEKLRLSLALFEELAIEREAERGQGELAAA